MKNLRKSTFHEPFGNIPRTLRPDDTMADLVGYFVRNPDFNTVIIEGDKGKILGVVNKETLLKSLFEHVDPDSPLEKFINTDFVCLSIAEEDPESLVDLIEGVTEDLIIQGEGGSYHTVASYPELLKMLKKELRARESTYRALLDSAYEAMVVIDTQGRIVIFNRAAGKMLRADPDKALGLPIKEVIPNTRLLDVLSSGRQDVRQRHTIGERTFLTHRTPLYLDGTIIGAMAQFQDISDVEDPLSQLADMREFITMLELILENAYVGIIFCDAKGVIRFMNRQYEELLGVPKEEAYGKHITEYFPDSRLPIVIKNRKPEY